MDYVIDIDWNEGDDTRLPWTLASRAADPASIQPGRYVVAGRGTAVAVAEVIDHDEHGIILRPLQGPASARLLSTANPPEHSQAVAARSRGGLRPYARFDQPGVDGAPLTP